MYFSLRKDGTYDEPIEGGYLRDTYMSMCLPPSEL